MPAMRSKYRIILAFLVAPLVTPLCILIWNIQRVDVDHGFSGLVSYVLSTILAYGIPAEVVGFLVGIPLFLIYRRAKISSPYAYALGGAAISQVPIALFMLTGTLFVLTGQAAMPKAWLSALPLSLACGALSALVFRQLSGE